MRLIGRLDSPYVRRVAISLHLLDVPFRHEPLSVFRDVDAFGAVNPVVKAPTLVTDDGTVLMDSGLILQLAAAAAAPARRLAPEEPRALARALRIEGLALAACEKAVQIVYELRLRPAEKRHAPWLDRVRGQLGAACRLLEAEMPSDGWVCGARPLAADVAAAVAWSFMRHVLEEGPAADAHPHLAGLAARAEALPAFRAAPQDG